MPEDVDAVEQFVSSAEVIELPVNRAIVLRNATCAYCGLPFGESLPSTKDHVVGRRFVPRGCFQGQWNLILNACEKCNGHKADLENDISIITMMPDSMGRYAVEDDRLRSEVVRRAAKARSRRTRKAVVDSSEQLQIKGAFGPANFTFNLIAPAQVDDQRLFQLAHYHFRGFFYFITYQVETRRGGFMQGDFHPVVFAGRADWGRSRLRWFMNLVRTWDLRFHGVGADGFFKILIRRHHQGLRIWAWAIEWNQSMRIAGFAGESEIIRVLMSEMPTESLEEIYHTESERVLMRREIALPEEEDDLFSVSVANG